MTIIKFRFPIRKCGAIDACIFVASFLSFILQQYPLCTLPRKGTYFFITWRVPGESEGRRSGESEGVVKALKTFQRQHICHLGADLGYIGIFYAGGVYHQSTKFICKGIIEAFINRPVVVLQC